MIQFSLKCDRDHRFDSWFQNSAAFDKLHASGMVSCSVCGSVLVEKAPMAPRVQAARDTAPGKGALTKPAHPAEQALAELRRQIEKNSTYVGRDFAREARAIHDGEAPKRQIHGEARPEEARALIEDGVPVMPLPFAAGRKTS